LLQLYPLAQSASPRHKQNGVPLLIRPQSPPPAAAHVLLLEQLRKQALKPTLSMQEVPAAHDEQDEPAAPFGKPPVPVPQATVQICPLEVL